VNRNEATIQDAQKSKIKVCTDRLEWPNSRIIKAFAAIIIGALHPLIKLKRDNCHYDNKKLLLPLTITSNYI
jgi:hypothetical protein